jgi:hypothetical protein
VAAAEPKIYVNGKAMSMPARFTDAPPIPKVFTLEYFKDLFIPEQGYFPGYRVHRDRPDDCGIPYHADGGDRDGLAGCGRGLVAVRDGQDAATKVGESDRVHLRVSGFDGQQCVAIHAAGSKHNRRHEELLDAKQHFCGPVRHGSHPNTPTPGVLGTPAESHASSRFRA